MKKIIWLSIVIMFFTSLRGVAQDKSINDLLIKKWIVDTVAMKVVFLEKLEKDPKYEGLDDEQKKIAVKTAIDKVAKLTIEYKSDGTCISTTSKGSSKSLWNINNNGKTITTKTDGKPDKIITIREVSENKLVIISSEGTIICLKVE